MLEISFAKHMFRSCSNRDIYCILKEDTFLWGPISVCEYGQVSHYADGQCIDIITYFNAFKSKYILCDSEPHCTIKITSYLSILYFILNLYYTLEHSQIGYFILCSAMENN